MDFNELAQGCDETGGAVVCMSVNYDQLTGEHHPPATSGYCISPRSVVLIREALCILEERVIWTMNDGPPTDAEWQTIKADIDRAQLDIS